MTNSVVNRLTDLFQFVLLKFVHEEKFIKRSFIIKYHVVRAEVQSCAQWKATCEHCLYTLTCNNE